MMFFRVLFAALLLIPLMAECSNLPFIRPFVAGRMPAASEINHPQKEGNDRMTGLQIRLKAGESQPPKRITLPEAKTEPLSQDRIRKVLDRLAPLAPESADIQEFAWPPKSPPPPRPGRTIDQPFPPPDEKEQPETTVSGPLEVLRRSPEGDVPLAPHLSVTFSQPMVSLTSHGDLAAQAVPVRLTPQPPGQWRWVGTKTLFFEPDHRFPMATDYRVEIPEGTASALGGLLDRPVKWGFATPPPQLKASFPTGGPHRLDPLIFASFDQQIDPEAVLASMRVTYGSQTAALRPADQEEVDADQSVSRLAESAGQGRWLAFRAQKPFPADTDITVGIAAGTPSAEGPVRTPKAQSFHFKTYGPMKVQDHRCLWDKECPPLTPWEVRFSNPIDEASFDESMVLIEPAVPGLKFEVRGRGLVIYGQSKGRTTYEVTLKAALGDIYDQDLGRDKTVKFETGSARPIISAPAGDFVVLDPSAKPGYSVFTINYDKLNLRVYNVQPEDFPAYSKFIGKNRYGHTKQNMPGRLVEKKTLSIEAEADQMVESLIDLSHLLEGGFGHLILEIEPSLDGFSSLSRSKSKKTPILRSWVQATHIGLDAFADSEELVVWTNVLENGAPLSGVKVGLVSEKAEAVTDGDGLARLPLPGKSGRRATALVARQGQDSAILRENRYWWQDEGWRRRPARDELRWYVFDDRQMYRPGEEVHVKGWVRLVGGGKKGDVGLFKESSRPWRCTVIDPQGNEIHKGVFKPDALGGFDLAFTLPKAMNLGEALLKLEASAQLSKPSLGEALLKKEAKAKFIQVDGLSHTHIFQVQEFRRPEFEVTSSAGEGPYMVGDRAQAEVSAKYYAGGGLANADVSWEVRSSVGHFTPPGWDRFAFGAWTPWWLDRSDSQEKDRIETFTGQTDASGIHRLRIDFEAVSPPRAGAVTAEATVMDVNRQAWTATQHLLVHPARHYVGLRSDKLFVQAGQPLTIESIVTDLDGQPITNRPIVLTTKRLDWTFKNGTWREVEEDVRTYELTSAKEPLSHVLELPEGGKYVVTASVEDPEGRKNESEITRWISGGKRPPAREVEQEEVFLVPDRREYQPGDTAEVLVQAPFWPAEGLMTWRRSGLVGSQRFTTDGPSHTLRIPIEEAHIPNLHVQIDLVGAAERIDDKGKIDPKLPKRPAFASGKLNLSVPPLARVLSLEASPREQKLEPGGQTTVDIVLKDRDGRPVQGGQVAVVVVDEAVLALTDYTLSDPMDVFYRDRSADVGDYHSREDIVLASPEEFKPPEERDVTRASPKSLDEMSLDDTAMYSMAMEGGGMPRMPMAAAPPGGADDGGGKPIRMRLDFNALATFAPAVPTDAQGRARVEVKVPDNLTRYRVMAVAVADEKMFGIGESTITARLPLMVRPSPPRFLNFGDRFEMPVVVQNQTDQAMDVDLAIRATNIELIQSAGVRVSVPANDRAEVRFPAASLEAGTARFQVGAVSGRWADAAQGKFPVWTPATTEAMAVYGQIDEGSAAQPVTAPDAVFPQFGGLEITTSSTALQALTDAVIYLVAYPFECSEQLASRIISVAALRDVLTAFEAEGLPSPEEIVKVVERDIERLRGLQNSDGGFPVWRRGYESWPFHSIHTAHALQRAEEKGFEVPPDMAARAMSYLRNIKNHIPSWYDKRTRNAIIAYALYVRNLAGDKVGKEAGSHLKQCGLQNLSLEAVGWLLSVLSDAPGAENDTAAILRHLENRVTETAGAAGFVTSYGDGEYLLLHSDRRTDGIILEALIKEDPKNDLIPKVVQGLLAHRKRGRWGNTQENVFILLALDSYFNTYESTTPDFVARTWLGQRFAGETSYKGRTTDYHQINIPMSVLVGQGTEDVILSKEGPGRLYYRLGLRYAPKELILPPADHGFAVQRSYEAVDDPADVKRDPTGTWRVKAGARVRVRLTMAAEARRYHVALVDPLPAGLEALNPALAVTGSVPIDTTQKQDRRFWWWRPWYEHQNLRDERAEAFTPLLWEGVYNYTYLARATTPGHFVIPPTKAEEMYAPETFGRCAGDRMIVE